MPERKKLSEIDHSAKVRIVELLTHLKEHKKNDCLMGNKCIECGLAKHLADLGFVLGEILEIEQSITFGFPMLVKVKGATYAICDIVASHIMVEEI